MPVRKRFHAHRTARRFTFPLPPTVSPPAVDAIPPFRCALVLPLLRACYLILVGSPATHQRTAAAYRTERMNTTATWRGLVPHMPHLTLTSHMKNISHLAWPHPLTSLILTILTPSLFLPHLKREGEGGRTVGGLFCALHTHALLYYYSLPSTCLQK